MTNHEAPRQVPAKGAAEALRLVVHDLVSSIGAIRMAISAALDEPDDADFVRTMLTGAEGESLRLAAALETLPALVTRPEDRSSSGTVDLGVLVGGVARRLRHRGVDARVRNSAKSCLVRSDVHQLGEVTLAVCGVLAVRGRTLTVGAAWKGESPAIRIERGSERMVTPAERSLFDMLGATADLTVDAIDPGIVHLLVSVP